MNNQLNPQSDSSVAGPSGRAIIQQIKQAGIRHIVSVPDIVTSDGLLWPIARDPDFELIRVCKEDEGVSICAAMSYTNTRALLLMQQTGLMDSLNAVRAMGMDYQLPVCMMVGLQGKEPDLKPAQSRCNGVRIIEPILDVMGLSHRLVETPDSVNTIATDINGAYRASSPFCFLVGRPPI